jgi:hypothetical protein
LGLPQLEEVTGVALITSVRIDPRSGRVGTYFDEVAFLPDTAEPDGDECGDIWCGYSCTLQRFHRGPHLAGIGEFGEHLFTAEWRAGVR